MFLPHVCCSWSLGFISQLSRVWFKEVIDPGSTCAHGWQSKLGTSSGFQVSCSVSWWYCWFGSRSLPKTAGILLVTSCFSCMDASARSRSYLGAAFVPCSAWSRHPGYLLPSPIASVINVPLSGCSDGSGVATLSWIELLWCTLSPAMNVSGGITRVSGSLLSWTLLAWNHSLFFTIIKFNVAKLKMSSDMDPRNLAFSRSLRL